MWQSIVIVTMGIFGAFGGLLGGSVLPYHDSDGAKTLESEYYEGYAQQTNDTSETRQMVGTDGTEAAPQAAQTETEEERPLIDVSRHSTQTPQTASSKNEVGGNVSVLVE